MTTIYEIKCTGVDPSTEWEFLFGSEKQYHQTMESAQQAIARLTGSAPEAFDEFPDVAENINYYVQPVTRNDFHLDSLGLREWREAQRAALTTQRKQQQAKAAFTAAI